jgi:hypothetical protein
MTTIGTGGAAPGSEEDEIRALAQEAEDRELAQEEDRALALLGLLITQVEPRGEKAASECWVHRRTDRIELLDENLLRWQVHLDYEVPPEVWGISTDDLTLIPLAPVGERGTKLRSLDMIDGAGCTVARATPDEIGPAMARALQVYAEKLLADERQRSQRPGCAALLPTVAAQLASIASDTDPSDVQRAPARIAAMKSFEAAAAESLSCIGDEEVFQRCVIMTHRDSQNRDIGLATVLRELDSRIMITAVLPAPVRGRSTLKLTWIESREPGKPPFVEWLGLRMAWNELKLQLPVHGASRTRYYRIETTSPSDDVSLEWSGLAASGSYVDCDEGDPAHLRLAMRSLPPDSAATRSNASAHVALRPTSKGFLIVALFACALCTLLLGVGLWRLEDLRRDVESSAALLLFVPGLLSLFVVRAGEHPIASRYFSGVRVVVAVSAMCVFLAGGLLILDIDPVKRRFLWFPLVASSAIALLAVVASYRPFLTELLRGVKKARPEKGQTVGDAPGDAPASRLGSLPAKNPRLAVCAAGLAVGVISVVTSLFVYGPHDLSVEGRLKAEIARAADHDDSKYRKVTLSKFARIPWTRMYVFNPKTSAHMVFKAVGERRAAAGIEAGHHVPARVPADRALIVLVDGSKIVRTFELPTSMAAVTTGAAYPKQCFFVPTDVWRVRAALQRGPVEISVEKPDADCGR